MSKKPRRPLAARPDNPSVPAESDVEALGNELRALPELQAPPRLFERVRERLDEDGGEPAPARAKHRRAIPLAVAASVVVLAVAGLFTWRANVGPAEVLVVQTDRADSETPVAAKIEALMERSRALEERRRASLVFDAPTAPEQLLRARIGGIDAALNDQLLKDNVELAERESLLRDRVELMNTLANIEGHRQRAYVQQVAF